MLVYLITNLVNSKRYVGATTRTLRQRFQEHVRGSRRERCRQVIQCAIKKHGVENFTIIKLQDCETLEELERLETFWIRELHTLVEQHGYNIARSHRTMLGRHHTDDVKRRLSEMNSGPRHPMWGRCQTSEAREKIRLNNQQRRPVEQLTLDGTFIATYTSVAEAARMTNHPDQTKIGLCCRGRRLTTRGYKWRYVETDCEI